MNKYNIIGGAVAALLWAWLIVSFLDVVSNNLNGAQYMPLNFFVMLSGGF